MTPRNFMSPAMVALLVACNDLGSGGCGGMLGSDASVYPRASAPLTAQVMRARVTQTGLEQLAEAVPGIMEAACTGNPTDGTATCAIDEECSGGDQCNQNNKRVRFYVGDGSSLSTTSYLALELGSFAGNIHLDLFSDAVGGGLTVTVGCDGPEGTCVLPSQWVTGSLDMVMYMGFAGANSACAVKDDDAPGLTIKSFQFTLRPLVKLGDDGKRYLTLVQDDIDVQRAELDLDFDANALPQDPRCEPDSTCSTGCGLLDAGFAVAGFMLGADFIAQLLADRLADMIIETFADQPLELEGALSLDALLPLPTARANPTAFLLAASLNSPKVTGTSGTLGWNFDVDGGFAANHGACVPQIAAPAVTVPTPPDPGQLVRAPDPVTGVMKWEPFDVALMLSQSVLARAAFEMFDGGSLCLRLGAEPLEELTGGVFVPTVAVLGLLAPGLAAIAPQAAPVDLHLVPRQPPTITFGNGTGSGETRQSHFQLLWPEVWVEMYPLVDDTRLAAITFSVDLNLGVSLEPRPDGRLQLMVDRLAFENLEEIYNEMTTPFDGDGVSALLGVFMPLLLNGEAIDLPINADALGIPLVPVVRAVERSQDGSFLSVFARFCTDVDLANAQDALCSNPQLVAPDDGNGASPRRAGEYLAVMQIGYAAQGRGVRVRASSTLDGPLELAYRVDGAGAWYGFKPADAGNEWTLEHPLLAVVGTHRLDVMARPVDRPGLWSEIAGTDIVVDNLAPAIQAVRRFSGVEIAVADDLTPAAEIVVRAEIRRGDSVEQLPWAVRSDITVEQDADVLLWAMDGAGRVSQPLTIAGIKSGADASIEEAGCMAVSPNAAWLLVVAVLWRRRSR